MKILYFCHTGVHTALVGAGIHLGLMPADRLPENKEIYQLPYFDGLSSGEVGTPFYLGSDQKGYEVFVFGVNHEPEVYSKAIKDVLDIYGFGPDQYLLVDVLKCNNRLISIGGWFSLVPGWNHLGRTMAVRGLKTAYPQIKAEVARVKAQLH